MRSKKGEWTGAFLRLGGKTRNESSFAGYGGGRRGARGVPAERKGDWQDPDLDLPEGEGEK